MIPSLPGRKNFWRKNSYDRTDWLKKVECNFTNSSRTIFEGFIFKTLRPNSQNLMMQRFPIEH